MKYVSRQRRVHTSAPTPGISVIVLIYWHRTCCRSMLVISHHLQPKLFFSVFFYLQLHCQIEKKSNFPPCFFCRVRDQTHEASHLVPETDRGLQECDDHRLDIFLEEWHRPLCPHPQVQTSADVRNTHQIISTSLQRCICTCKNTP